jgi:hypothetical protein
VRTPWQHPLYKLVLLAGMFAAIALLWNTPVVYPVKVFTVLVHELGHGLAAVLTGGSMLRIEISPELGGVCYTRGGSSLLILTAGYLGSMVFGCLLILGAARTNLDRLISTAIGIALLVLTAVFVRSTFGLVFGLAFGAAMAAMGRWAPTAVNELLLLFLGTTSALYAVIDIKEDLITRTVPGSDAYQMSQLIPLPPVAWGVIWAATAAVAVYLTLRTVIRAGNQN